MILACTKSVKFLVKNVVIYKYICLQFVLNKIIPILSNINLFKIPDFIQFYLYTSVLL